MTEVATHGTVEPTLRARGPAYSVMQECLRIQGEARPLGKAARFFGLNPLCAAARSWYRGALGELEVAAELARLGPEWTILHAVPVGSADSDIDHVVIGPPGIYTINTKNHSGKRIWVGGHVFMVNGFKTNHIRNSLFEAKRASGLLSKVAGGPVKVTPLIVVVSPAGITRGRGKQKVIVLTSGRLFSWLTHRPRVHSDAAIAYFSMIAEERATWHSRAHVVDDTLRHVQRFERLQHEVRVARTRVRRWLVLAMAGMVGVSVLLLGALGILVVGMF
jgi:hypothetical protein